jgi:hypothetical protein
MLDLSRTSHFAFYYGIRILQSAEQGCAAIITSGEYTASGSGIAIKVRNALASS